MKFFKLIIATFFVCLLFGCAGKYQEPRSFNTSVNGLTKEKIKKAILDSSTKGRSTFGTWKLEPIGNDTIRGHLFNRSFEVMVNIKYTEQGYSIDYYSASENLKSSSGKVHRNYNRWVNNLDAKIKENIFKEK
ncbi:hypothetical protein [Gilliamella sp. G0441]|uniref:hypothetical protein n=1 Tax=Gilliamella sp. G0441 TaxID=3384760 RepID=UPI0025DCB731|nr:hypothetical protein [uncultured Gilliamella sp.]